MAAPRSANGRLAVAEGLTPGSTAYKSFMRDAQRHTTSTGTQRRGGEKFAAAIKNPEVRQALLNRQAVRDAGTPQPGQRARITAKLVVGNSAAEQRRANTARVVTSQPLTREQIKLLQEDPRAFLNADFFGLDADDADGYGVESAQVLSVNYT